MDPDIHCIHLRSPRSAAPVVFLATLAACILARAAEPAPDPLARGFAEVRLNGKSLGVLWAFPFRVEVTGALEAAGNRLEIDVVNFWPNRIIGDQHLPPGERRTRTNIRKLTKDTPLVESGLVGPVRILEASWSP